MYLLLFVYFQSKRIKFQFKTKYTTVINTSCKINKFVCESISLAKLKWTDYIWIEISILFKIVIVTFSRQNRTTRNARIAGFLVNRPFLAHTGQIANFRLDDHLVKDAGNFPTSHALATRNGALNFRVFL